MATQQGREHRAQAWGQFAFVDEVAQRQPGQRHDHPHVDTEVVEGEGECLGDGGITQRVLIVHRNVEGVIDGFGDTPEHQDGTHTTGEEHGEPDNEGVFGLVIVIA